jgi:flavin-dependent dehydrogenase
MRRIDLAIVGGGPAGLATAIEAARRGLEVRLFERQRPVPDKACGEGLMPSGRAALERLGVLRHLDPDDGGAFIGVRFLQEDGASVIGRFRDGYGLGLRRLELSRALDRTAREAGASVEHEAPVRDVQLHPDHVSLIVNEERVEAKLLVAADGLGSPLRRQLGLEGRSNSTRRFGLRRHFRGVSPGEFVDVHWSPGVEAYVTPVGPGRCGVAFLFDARHTSNVSFERLLSNFPMLEEQLRGGAFDSEARGAGPLLRRVRGCVKGRAVLVGDAAGYVDAITGEGLSLAFTGARSLGEVLPDALSKPALLSRYARAHAGSFRRYALWTSALLWIARRPKLRRSLLAALSKSPSLFERALHWAM